MVRTVVVDRQRVRVSVRPGHGPGLPLVLMNGIGSSLELLDPLVAAFDPATTVIRFDVPGTGGSPAPALPYLLVVLARTVGKLLDELGVDRVDVLGISWGGALAQQFAWQNPRRCHRLVLVATTPGVGMIPARPSVMARMMTPRRHRDPDYASEVAGRLYGGVFRRQPERARTVLHAESRLGPKRGYLFQLMALWGWSSLVWLPTIRQRALVIAGRDDPLIPAVNGWLMAAGLPRGTLHLHNDGHLALVTDGERMAEVIRAFLAPQ
ncbi:MAG: poly(3-hydroxyalkanoate) depolymerase [Actinomycetota bacterium]|nr:poly(3-hydroxyalkanoate) depolymerase [Actinomycetota bacterium]